MRPILIVLCSATLLVACGLKGPLYLPDKRPDKEPVSQVVPEKSPQQEVQLHDEPESPADSD